MVEERLDLKAFLQKSDIVFTSGQEQTERQKVEAKGLPIYNTNIKVTAQPAKMVKPQKVSAR